MMNEDGSVTVMRDMSEAEKRSKDLGKRIADEAEAWKVAQLAVHIMADDGITSDGAISAHVATARKILAESRRQTAAATGERDDG